MASSSSSTTKKEVLIAVGIDIGSLNARISLSPPVVTEPEPNNSTSSSQQNQKEQQLPHCYQHPNPGTIVPFESGERYTIALSTIEPKAIADPSNDQFWDAPSPSNKNNKKKKAVVEEETVHIFGEAASKSLQREKKPLASHSVRSLLVLDAAVEEGDGGGEEEEGGMERRLEEQHAAARAFISHLITQATNAAHSHPSSLRLVLATPDRDYAPTPTTTPTTKELVKVAQQALIDSIRKVGWDTSPDLLTGPSRNKREKKVKIESLESIPRIVGVLTESMAVCHAHNLFQFTEYGPTWNGDSSSSNNTNNNTNPPPKDFTNILIIDWGHTSLKLTHLHRLSPTTQILTSPTTTSHPTLSGAKLLAILVQHVAELFERQPSTRGSGVRSAHVLKNAKARAKLDQVCEGVLRTLSSPRGGTKVTVMVDGLYEGMDCNVEVRKARFDMLIGGWLKVAEETMNRFVGGVEGGVDVILTAGNAVCMPAAAAIVNRLGNSSSGGGGKKCWMGRGVAEVPPEETVAMGCAMYAAMVTSDFCREGLAMAGGVGGGGDDAATATGESKVDDSNNLVCGGGTTTTSAVEEDVLLCPVGVGLSLQEGDSASIILIESGTPLPASVAQIVDVKGCSSGSLGIVQIGCLEAAENGSAVKEKLVGTIGGIPKSVDEIEVCMELSIEGKISLCVNGGPIISF